MNTSSTLHPNYLVVPITIAIVCFSAIWNWLIHYWVCQLSWNTSCTLEYYWG